VTWINSSSPTNIVKSCFPFAWKVAINFGLKIKEVVGKGTLKKHMLNYYVLQHATIGREKIYLHLLENNLVLCDHW
jgi:hypothetical protein